MPGPEYAARVAETYDKIKSRVEIYKKGVPEGEDVFEHLKKRAYKLDVGRDNPVLQAIIGLAVSAAINATPVGRMPGVGSTVGTAVKEKTGKAIREINRDARSGELRQMYE